MNSALKNRLRTVEDDDSQSQLSSEPIDQRPAREGTSYQPQDSLSEFLCGPLRVDIRETEKQGRRSISTRRPVRQCFAVQPVFLHACNEAAIRASSLQPQDQVHASWLCIDSHVFPQHGFQACDRRFPALAIKLAHPLDVAREVPFRYERRDDRLRKPGTAACKGLTDFLEPFNSASGVCRTANGVRQFCWRATAALFLSEMHDSDLSHAVRLRH